MEYRTENTDVIEIDIMQIMTALKPKLRRILLTAVLTAMAVLVSTVIFAAPRYQSGAMFYVCNHPEGAADGITSADISAARELVKSCIVILNTRQTMQEVISHTQTQYSCEELQDMLQAEAVDATELFQVTVTAPRGQEAEQIVSAIVEILPQRITDVLAGASVQVVDAASGSEPCVPNYGLVAMAGFLAGLMLSACWTLLKERHKQ